MILPRGRGQSARYGRHKVVAALVTFAVVWIWLKWFAPDVRESLEAFGVRTPEHCFREKVSGELVQARVTVEETLPDSAVAGTPLGRWRVRSDDGHPFLLLAEGPLPGAPSDTLRLRGRYDWDPRGGTVRVLEEDGWIRTRR